MRSEHAVAELTARQLSLVTALVAGGTPPAGVDPERVRIQALALVRKRSRSVARHRPELAANLGADFWPAFQRYAAADPAQPANTSDAQRFARYVRKSRRSRLIRLFLARILQHQGRTDESDEGLTQAEAVAGCAVPIPAARLSPRRGWRCYLARQPPSVTRVWPVM
jgi:hypothetical protein